VLNRCIACDSPYRLARGQFRIRVLIQEHPSVQTGESLTRGTIWLALSLYAAAEAVKAFRRRTGFCAEARWLNTLGCAAFLAHVAYAFHYYHGWSHPEAYQHTARQTAEWFGWNWGGGLYFNYAFGLVWLGDVVWSWCALTRHRQQPKWMTWGLHGFFFFMMFNGAVLFARDVGRWFGSLLCLILLAAWWSSRRRGIAP